MLYESTRGGMKSVPSAQVIKMGIAPDGGLFVPEQGIKLSMDKIARMAGMTYQERAYVILSSYLTDYTENEIRECVSRAYNNENFGNSKVAPMAKLSDILYVQELWHGPTSAFKDMALQILPHLLVKAVNKTGETYETVILVATSGDTGKAALEGFKDVRGTRIIVFYPEKGVSKMQKMQMVTQQGENVYALAVKGNFDDTQSGVKAIFTDAGINKKMLEKGFRFSSANSINWGRLVPQIVYYFSAYADMVCEGEIEAGEQVNFVVPTGNFGNILAAFYAKKMGLPVNRLICASNENNVLTEFINTGVYNRNREFKRTISPSMDILISSNLERLLFEITGHDSVIIEAWMNRLREDGIYKVDNDTAGKIGDIFWAEYSTEEDIIKTIEGVYKDYGYVTDTHTAVGIDVYDKYVITTGDMTKSVVMSTASPFKFNESVAAAVFGKEAVSGKSEFQLLQMLSEKLNLNIPQGLKNLDKKQVRHTGTCEKKEMKAQVEKILF